MNTLNQHLLNRLTQIRSEPLGKAYVGFREFTVKRQPGAVYGFDAGDQLLDINEVAKRLGIPKGTVYELCRHRSRIHGNALPHFKVGRRLKFNWTTVIAWLDALEKAGAK
jgi:excisionase family DNA binding protein